MSSAITLAERQRLAGGVWGTDQTGRASAMHFGNPHAEYAAAQLEAAVYDPGDRTQLELTGRDRQKFLHNFCTNDIRSLVPGEGCEAFVTTVQGKVWAHIWVYLAADSLWIDSAPESALRLIRHLTKYQITEDVEFHDRTPDLGSLLALGPEVPARLASWAPDLESLPRSGHRLVMWRGAPLQLRRIDWTGSFGWQLVAPREQLAALWSELLEARCRAVGFQAWHALRIEAGWPCYGLDVTEDNLAQEVCRTARAISFTKGCYLGQEPIARIDALGHVNQELRVIRFRELPPPEPATPLYLPGEARDVGRVTSSAVSFRNDLPVALGYLRRNYCSPGTCVVFHHGEREVPGEVVAAEADPVA